VINEPETADQHSPGRKHDAGGLTSAELERARRELMASLALARPGSAVRDPILAQLSAIEAELTERHAGRAETS